MTADTCYTGFAFKGKPDMQFAAFFNSIWKTFVPVHREGWPFIAGFLAVALVLGWLWDPLFWIGLFLTGWCAYFFRDPERVSPVSDDFVLAPADGKVTVIDRAVPPPELELGGEAMLRIGIFMNVFNVHINRGPVTGRILRKVHKPGAFFTADHDKAGDDNERLSLLVETGRGNVPVVQIAGLVARRIVCWAKEGETMEQGVRFGLIRFGSRVDIYLPEGAKPAVHQGQVTICGETIIARYDELPIAPSTRIG